jgi:hypothetical protein
VAGAVVSLALALAVFDFSMFTGGDNAGYYALTRALATGRGYVDLIAPGVPPQTQYPPGYPLLLVPFYWLFGGAYVGLKFASLLAGAAALAGLWKLARRDPAVPPWAAAAAVWLFGLYPVFRVYTHWVLSDMAYTAISLFALAMYARAARETPPEAAKPKQSGKQKGEKHPAGSRWAATDVPGGWWLAATLVALFGFYTRTAGVALLLAPLGWALWRRSWRRAGVVAAVLLLGAGPWFLWTNLRSPETGGYLDQVAVTHRLDPTSERLSVGGYVARSASNFLNYALRDLPQMFWPQVVPPAKGTWRPPPLLVRVLGFFLGGALVAFGVFRALRARGLMVTELYALLTFGILLVWAWTGDRFFLTLAPLLWLYILVGLEGASQLVARSVWPARIVTVALAALLFVGALREIPPALDRTRAWLDGDELGGYPPYWQDYFSAARWIGENAPDAVIIARKPTFAWYWSGGRPSFVYPFHGDPDATWASFREKGATHLLLDYNSRMFLEPVIQPHADDLELVHASPRRAVVVVRIRPESP